MNNTLDRKNDQVKKLCFGFFRVFMLFPSIVVTVSSFSPGTMPTATQHLYIPGKHYANDQTNFKYALTLYKCS